MAAELRFTPKSFKDYFLIMQVHPEADGAMIDAAYWHLARRYSEAAPGDPSARKKLDELNEAYHVLGSGPRRAEYEKLRAQVLGEKALPVAPEAPAPAQPLTVMRRQRPRPRQEEPEQAPPRRRPGLSFRVPAWQNMTSAFIIVLLGGAALAAQVYPPLVVALLICGLALTSIPLVRRLPKVASSAMALQPQKAVPEASAEVQPEPASPPGAIRQAPDLAEAVSSETAEAIAQLREANAPSPKERTRSPAKPSPHAAPGDSDMLRQSTEATIARLREVRPAREETEERSKDIDYAAASVDHEAPADALEDAPEPTNAAAS